MVRVAAFVFLNTTNPRSSGVIVSDVVGVVNVGAVPAPEMN
jgi:hypothetical protein